MSALPAVRRWITHSAAYRVTSRHTLQAAIVLAVCANGVLGQSASGFVPSRCVSDSTALPPRETITTADSVAPGITYRCIYVKEGPWAMHVVTIDLGRGRYAIEGARAHDAMFGREKVSDMVRRLQERGDTTVVAINADFFNLRTGEIENNTVIRGRWVKGVVITDSPHDEFDNAHTQFAVDSLGRPLIGRFELHGEVRGVGSVRRLLGVNHRPPRDSGLVLYTPWYGERTPSDSAKPVELTLQRASGTGSYTVRDRSLTGGGNGIPRDGVVLSATGAAREFLQRVARSGGTVTLTTRLGTHAVAPRTVVGGWPRIIVDGHSVAARADTLEGTMPRFSAARHPRSAIALSRDSTQLMLVVVDGRRSWSVGMTLTELADQLLALGAYQAMNLDGGGSSTLWIRGTIVNYPSDATGERPVGNALIVLPRR